MKNNVEKCTINNELGKVGGEIASGTGGGWYDFGKVERWREKSRVGYKSALHKEAMAHVGFDEDTLCTVRTHVESTMLDPPFTKSMIFQ